MSKVWLVTGSAHGLGRSIVETALSQGDRVVATARKTDQLEPLKKQYGDRVLVLALDVTDEAAAHIAATQAVEAFGQIDVLVNNAGYGHFSPFEQTPAQSFRDQIETNFMGTVNVTRAVLPYMRNRRSGHIFQISSIGGRIASPGLSAYSAAKWAVGGFSVGLSAEVAPLGIHVCVIEPGGMRTNWGKRACEGTVDVYPEYQATVGEMQSMMGQYAGQETGSPEKVAQAIWHLASHDSPPVRLMLGGDALQYVTPMEESRMASDKRWEQVTLSTDFASLAMPEFPSA